MSDTVSAGTLPISHSRRSEIPPYFSGRRMRVFARLIWQRSAGEGYELMLGKLVLATTSAATTFAGAAALLAGNPLLSVLRLQIGGEQFIDDISKLVPPDGKGTNPMIPDELQDLANEIFVDIHEACAAFDDPDLYYPGVDDGIEPVTDEHVWLVIPAIERELSRETRDYLPYAPLHALPWRVQRALVERRRLRFTQWGITYQNWRKATYSLWNIPEDPDWLPRWPVA